MPHAPSISFLIPISLLYSCKIFVWKGLWLYNNVVWYQQRDDLLPENIFVIMATVVMVYIFVQGFMVIHLPLSTYFMVVFTVRIIQHSGWGLEAAIQHSAMFCAVLSFATPPPLTILYVHIKGKMLLHTSFSNVWLCHLNMKSACIRVVRFWDN